MSLCGQCGLDLDTGETVDLEVELDEAPPPEPVEAGPPAIILVIGLLALVAGLFLAILSIIRLEGLGAICLAILSLFGAFAAVQFLRGQTLKLMVVALMLGAGVDLVAMIVMPVMEAEVKSGVDDPVTGDGVSADPVETDNAVPKPLSERIDTTKLTIGVLIFVVDAVLLVAVTSTGVRAYFDHKRRARDEGYVLP